MAATRGEYQAAAAPRRGRASLLAIVILVVFVLLFLWLVSRGSGGGWTDRTYDQPRLASRRTLGRRLGRWRLGRRRRRLGWRRRLLRGRRILRWRRRLEQLVRTAR